MKEAKSRVTLLQPVITIAPATKTARGTTLSIGTTDRSRQTWLVSKETTRHAKTLIALLHAMKTQLNARTRNSAFILVTFNGRAS